MKVNILNFITDVEVMGDNMRTINMELVKESECQSKYESEVKGLLAGYDIVINNCDCEDECYCGDSWALDIDVNNLNYKETVSLGSEHYINIASLDVDADVNEFYVVTKFENKGIETIWCRTEEEANLKIKEYDINVLSKISGGSVYYEDFIKDVYSYENTDYKVNNRYNCISDIYYSPKSYGDKKAIDVDGLKIVSDGNILTMTYELGYNNYNLYMRKMVKVVAK